MQGLSYRAQCVIQVDRLSRFSEYKERSVASFQNAIPTASFSRLHHYSHPCIELHHTAYARQSCGRTVVDLGNEIWQGIVQCPVRTLDFSVHSNSKTVFMCTFIFSVIFYTLKSLVLLTIEQKYDPQLVLVSFPVGPQISIFSCDSIW